MKKYFVFGEKVKVWNIISMDKELKLVIFFIDVNKFNVFNSVDFVLKLIKYLLDIGYMKKNNFLVCLLLFIKINK